MPTNAYLFFLTALIPLVIGAVYYHPKLMGGAWMKANKFTEASLEGGSMPVILGIAYVLSIILSFSLSFSVIHQGGVVASAMSTTEAGTWTPEAISDINKFMAAYGNNFRTFSHGALHGIVFAIFSALPLIGINALFERRGWKYILIHLGYWAITCALMGGVLCQTLEYAPLT